MSLSDRIAGLAARIGFEVGTKVNATHPALARAWVSFGYVAGQTVIHHAYGVASVERLAAGQYRINFATPMADANYCWAFQAAALAMIKAQGGIFGWVSGSQRFLDALARAQDGSKSRPLERARHQGE